MFLIRKTSVSDGATALRNALRQAGQEAKFTNKSAFQSRHLILNWGGQDDPSAPRSVVLNSQAARRVAMNKLAAFAVLAAGGVNIPKFFTDASEAANWRAQQSARSNPIIIARSTVSGSGGEGISVIRMNQNVPEGLPLYTGYIRKRAEYRVHVVKGDAIAVQQKRAVSDRERTEDENLIRNHDNGWVFATGNVDEHSDAAKEIAVRAAAALQLDVAAVDIVRGYDGEMYVLEANTKPGLESPTVLAAYVTKLTTLHP